MATESKSVSQPPSRLRRVRFGMRGMLLVTSLFCVVMTAWSTLVQPYRNQALSRQTVERLGGKLTSTYIRDRPWQRWLVSRMVGPREFVSITGVDLRNCDVTAADVERLAGLTRLQTLHLDRSELSDQNASVLAGCRELRLLSLSYTFISDIGIGQIGALPKLETLYLTGTKTSDDSIPNLIQQSSLERLFIRWTSISESGVEQLQNELPNCQIHHHTL